jgi:biotin synthase-like enzyme
MEFNQLIEKSNQTYLDNFPATTWFERAIFFSWYCDIGDCKYCYMSTQPKTTKKPARRSEASLIAETILCKKLGWRLGFFSGGHNAYTVDGFSDILKKVSQAYGEKIWINVGPLKKQEIKSYLPYAKGVVGAIETLNPKLHKYLCPSKPIEPMEEMFEYADEYGLKKGMTIIVGLGETLDDFSLLKKFIKKHDILKIHIYGLNPQKGTIFEKTAIPTKEYQAEWIARTRIAFPKLDIQAGIWVDKVDHVSLLLKAGATSISKYPALNYFGKKESQTIEQQAKLAGRKFQGTLTKLPKINIEKETQDIEVRNKLKSYLKKMS